MEGDRPLETFEVLVLSLSGDGCSRTAKTLASRGATVRVCTDPEEALEALESGPCDLVVSEAGDSSRVVLGALEKLARAHPDLPHLLIADLEADLLVSIINETRVSRVVSAARAVESIVDESLAILEGRSRDRGLDRQWESRCRKLEKKIDRLVREGIQREGAAHFLHDLLADLELASGVKEVASRCLARLVTMLKLDMAFIVIDDDRAESNDRFFSFGCPKMVLESIQGLPWRELGPAFGPQVVCRPILEAVPEAMIPSLSRSLRIKGVENLVLFELRVHDDHLGFVGVSEKMGSTPSRIQPVTLRPVVKQIAISIDNARMAQVARRSEGLIHEVFQHLSSTAVVCDSTGQILRCFDGRQHLFGRRSVEEKFWSDLLPTEEAEEIALHISMVSRSQEAIHLRALRWSLDGQERLLNLGVAPLPSGQVMVLIEDVTRRESMADDLKRARALTSSLFANAPAGVLFVRRSGEIVDINGKACAILHQSRSKLLGELLNARYPELWRSIAPLLEGGQGEATFRLPDGEPASVSFSITTLGPRNRTTGVLLQIQDTAELQSLRERLLRKDNLALMGQMVSFIAHEIKNPLFGISSAAQVLAREAEEEESQRISDAMLSEIDRLANLLEDLLVFGSKRPIDAMELDPRTLCEDLIALNAERTAGREISLSLISGAEHPVVIFDPARLKQILVNLVDNAFDATPRGGSITLRIESDPEECRIRVTNTGEPMPLAVQKRIFNLFFSTKPRGNGLGLAICQKIAEDHGGYLELESSRENGTCFSLHVPASTEGEVGQP